MQVKYDKKSDSKYILLKKGKVFETKKQEDWLYFDCSKAGEVLGVEILRASKHLISISSLNGKFVSYSAVDFKSHSRHEESADIEITTNKDDLEKISEELVLA